MLPRSTIVLGLLAAVVAGAGCDASDADAALLREGETEAHPDQHPDVVGDAGICDLVAHPSVFFVPVRRYDDFQIQVQVDAVWYEVDGETYDAMCLPDEKGGCRAWIAGWERHGDLMVATEYCGTVVETEVEVPIDDEGCHVVTQYLLQPVSTRGCLAEAPNPTPPPGPLPL